MNLIALALWLAPALAEDPVPPAADAPPATVPEQAPSPSERGSATTEVPSPSERGSAPEAAPAPAPAIAELQARIDAMQKQLDAQQEQLNAPRDAVEKDLEFGLDGYFRVRGYVFNHLFDDQTNSEGEYRDARYMQMRLRMQPQISYKDSAKFFFQLDALDDSIFGDNESLQSTALFASDPSDTNIEGQNRASLRISRAWTEIDLKVANLRAGRMANNWGMGILAASGDGFDDYYGENHYGSTADRVMFATRPVAIAQKAMGKEDSDVPLYLAVAVDRLVEDPLFQFYGYSCTPGLRQDDPESGYDPRCDFDGDGLTDRDNGFVDDSRTDSDRSQDWWADQDDDVWEMVYVLVYRGKDKKYLGAKGDLTAGIWTINRVQRETDSNVWIADAYVNAKNRGFHLEAEGLTIQGNTRAIALPGSFDPTGDGDPLAKKANIWGGVARFGYERPKWATNLESGYASGDSNVADSNFTGRPLHADYNVGLVLYEEVISRVTSARWSDDARGLWSNGGVYNSKYLFPNAHVYPIEGLELQAAFLGVWPDRPDGAIIQCREGDKVECASYAATASMIGWEIDAGVKYRMYNDHALFALEAGYAKATDRLPLEASGLNPNGKFFTLQSRVAYAF